MKDFLCWRSPTQEISEFGILHFEVRNVGHNYTGIGHMEGCRLGDNVKVGGGIYEATEIQLTQIPTKNKTMTSDRKNDTGSGDPINQSGSNFGNR